MPGNFTLMQGCISLLSNCVASQQMSITLYIQEIRRAHAYVLSTSLLSTNATCTGLPMHLRTSLSSRPRVSQCPLPCRVEGLWWGCDGSLFLTFFSYPKVLSPGEKKSQIAWNNVLSVLAVHGYLCPVKVEKISHTQSAHYAVDQNNTGKFLEQPLCNVRLPRCLVWGASFSSLRDVMPT